MNIRKPIDYSGMYMELDAAMKAGLPQMDLYCEIGRITSRRPEKGAAVAAAKYLQNSYPDATGFSPRNVRRMRDFYRTYESTPELLGEAMKISWTQNVVILEAELSPTEGAWYIRAAKHFNWSKLELMANIKDCAHEALSCDFVPSLSEEVSPAIINESICYSVISQRQTSIECNDRKPVVNTWTVLFQADGHSVHERGLSHVTTHRFRCCIQSPLGIIHRLKFIIRTKTSPPPIYEADSPFLSDYRRSAEIHLNSEHLYNG